MPDFKKMSSAGSEHPDFIGRDGGSNPSLPTKHFNFIEMLFFYAKVYLYAIYRLHTPQFY